MSTHETTQVQTYQQPKDVSVSQVGSDGLPYVRIESRHRDEWRVINPPDRGEYESAGWIVCGIATDDAATRPLLKVRRASTPSDTNPGSAPSIPIPEPSGSESAGIRASIDATRSYRDEVYQRHRRE